MAFLTFKHIKIAGVSGAIPKKVVENLESSVFAAEDVQKFISVTGVERFRAAENDISTSDLAFAAAEKLIQELNWGASEIEMLVFLSQTPDYILPNTAPILQDKLKLPKTCIAFDMTLGCSGYIFGLSTIASYMASGKIKKALFLCGDTPSKIVHKKDKTSAMLFGDAGTATALEFNSESSDELLFALGTDGSGYKAIIIPDGGGRNPFNENSLTESSDDGIIRHSASLHLDGMDVFSFGISQAPASVKEIMSFYNIEESNIDFFLFHQANLMMNEMIRKKLKLPKQKVPYSLADFGNTSSASIPITMIDKIKDTLKEEKNTLLMCGFGVGLSWGSCIIKTNRIIVPDLIEV